MAEPRTALVTGATGFIGSNLVQRLLSCGWDVHVIVRPKSDLGALGACVGKLTLWEHDGTTENLISALARSKPDVVFHLASLFLSAHTPKDVTPLIQSNVLFSTQLLEAMSECGVKRFVNTGTSWQHYENHEYSPVNLYAATKQAFEAILQYYVEAKSFNVVTLKLFDTFGPNDSRRKLFRLLDEAARCREPLAMSPGDQLIDLVYIDDVIDAYMVAADRLQLEEHVGHRAFSISSGKPLKLKKLVDIYCDITGAAIAVQWGGRPYRAREVMSTWDRGEILPGWRPRVSLEEGIMRLSQAHVIEDRAE